MNLRLPFDNKGFHIGYDLEANYGDFAKKWSPVGSLLVSDTWDTGIGRIGLLGAVSYSRLFSRVRRRAGFQLPDARRHLFGQQLLPVRRHGVCRAPLADDTRHARLPAGSIPATGPIGRPCYGAGTAGRREWLLPTGGHSLCAGRRPVPHPGLRPQAARLSPPAFAVAEPRPARAADRPVPELASDRETGTSTRSRPAPTFPNTIPSRRLPAEQRRSERRGRTGANARIGRLHGTISAQRRTGVLSERATFPNYQYDATASSRTATSRFRAARTDLTATARRPRPDRRHAADARRPPGP